MKFEDIKVNYDIDFDSEKVDASERMIDYEPHIDNDQNENDQNLAPPIHILSCFVRYPVWVEH